MSAVLALEDVTRVYPGPPPVAAVAGVTFDVAEGEMIAVVGPSGSGKSTLLNLMGALDRPTSGRLTIAGADVGRMDDRRLAALRAGHIGFVFQQFHLIDGLDAVENVAAGLLYRGLAPGERRRRAGEMLESVGLGHRLHHRATQLSGGEKQRVAIARALVGDPALVLADEPTGNLDQRNGAEIMALLERLNRAGHTVVLITHDPSLAVRASRRVRLVDGCIVADQATMEAAS